MPNPHYAVQAGTRIPQQRGPAETGAPVDTAGDCSGCRQKSKELDRLRAQLAQTQSGGGAAPRIGPAMVWAALAICGACLVFALAAIMRHG